MNKIKIVSILKILADRNRLRILNLLLVRRMCVCEIAFVLGVSQPSVSRHLKKMKEASLILSQKSGFWTDYYLSSQDVQVKALLKSIHSWIKHENEIQKDLIKLKKADRKRLCC